MAVDKSYGSGKSRSAANSRARQRAAAGQMTKGKKTTGRVLSRIAAENPITGFIGGGILPAKLMKAASALTAAGQVSKAEAVRARLAARVEGKTLSGNVNDVAMRNQSTSVFPRIDSSKVRTAPNRILEEQGRRRSTTRGFGTVNPEGYAALQSKPDFLGKGAFNVPIVDTRRMNPAQAKSALEKGVNQTAVYKRGVPSKPQKLNKVTKRLLGGR